MNSQCYTELNQLYKNIITVKKTYQTLIKYTFKTNKNNVMIEKNIDKDENEETQLLFNVNFYKFEEVQV